MIDRFWEAVTDADEPMTVLHAADLPSSIYGGGGGGQHLDWGLGDLPRWERRRDDAEEEGGTSLASESLLRHTRELGHIGQTRLDLGMCFASTPWRLAPHLLYTASVLHHGKPRAIYAITPDGAEALERAVKEVQVRAWGGLL